MCLECGSLPPERMFVYYDIRELSRQQKVGEYVCAWPPHITLGLFNTRKPDEFLDTISDFAAKASPAYIERGDMRLLGGGQSNRRKPVVEINDPTGELQALQRRLFRRLTKVAMTKSIQPWHFNSHYMPHVALNQISSEPVPLPQELTVDRIHVIQNLTPGETGHHRGIVRHVAQIALESTDQMAQPA